MNTCEYDGSEKASWGFIGDCGGDALLERHGQHRYIANMAQYVTHLHLGVAFLHLTFGKPPAGCIMGVLWHQEPHGPGKSPIIAMGSDEWTQLAKNYFGQLEKALAAFDKAVDWKSLPQSEWQMEM